MESWETSLQIEPVEVPVDSQLATEPARTVGDLFADKAMIKTIVAAGVAVLAGMTGWVADEDVVENLATLISGISIFVTIAVAQWEARERAHAQAEVTRELVYSPATVARKTRPAG